MGFISKLLRLFSGSTKTASTRSASVRKNATRKEHNVALDKGWLTLTQPYFFGRAHCSPNRRWVVGCSDSDGAGRGGHRESGYGRVVLVEHQTDKIMHELTSFARPFDAAVSDTGDYIVLDAGFGSALQGDVIAISSSGHERYRRRYSANVFNLGLSKCGRYASVQTANAPGDDGNRLEVIDLELGCTIFNVRPATGWADRYSFHVDAEGRLKAFGVEHKGLGRFNYSATGEFLDWQAFQAAQLDKGDYSTKLMAARDLLKSNATADSANKALSIADAALTEGAKDRPDWCAIAHRVRGESYELLGQLPEAVKAFEQALALNPKIGVQKRVVALRKKLGSG
ncbi:tetratricopeptide repeat protein [Serratia fonticola]|uniref:tetratricopeptide repeat protein n=1 Tax=Serratia fonticola TaxID=47917 RepID=UPI00192AB07A|nr:tetratricopeptide repeat protein [Serratia fonticola]MBL5864354.1 tetratricopeptide repeat protein [Serratia fonticola]